MGLNKIGAKAQNVRREFKDGWVAESDATGPKDEPIDRIIGPPALTTRALLFGYLLAFPGVPFLPWGNSAAIAVTLLALAITAVPLKGHDTAIVVRMLVVAALTVATLRLAGPPSTSIVLIGAFVGAAVAAARSFPYIYGLAAGVAVGAIVVQVFDWHLFETQQLLLSGRSWTPDRGGAEALHLAGFLLLAALLHFSGFEIDRLKTKAKDAEAARDAAVVDERARIARELHDVVSHHVTAMTLQAEAAAMTGDKQALVAVASTGREALNELRRMLGVLRHPDGEDASGALQPQPDLGRIDDLAERTSSGPLVRVERLGQVRALPAGVELCAYRLVQEALTNAAKHSDASAAEVTLTYGTAELLVDVLDNGRPLVVARVASSGLGLVGMRERVALLDGELQTGPREDAVGYRVHARLPIDR